MAKEGPEKAAERELLPADSAKSVRRGIAIVPLHVTGSARPRADRQGLVLEDGGTDTRDRASSAERHPSDLVTPERGADIPTFLCGSVEETSCIWTNNGWAGDLVGHKTCSDGYVQHSGGSTCH